MSDPQGAPTNDPWAPQSSSSQNSPQGSVPSTPQVPQTPQAQQPWGAPEQPAQPQQAQQPWGAPEQPAQPQQAQQPWGAPEQPAQPQQQWGAAPQPDAAWQGTQTQGGTAWTVAQPGIIPLRPLTVGELFNGAFQAVRVNPQTMFGFAFAIMAVVGLVQAFFASSSTSSLTRALSSGDTEFGLLAGQQHGFLRHKRAYHARNRVPFGHAGTDGVGCSPRTQVFSCGRMAPFLAALRPGSSGDLPHRHH